MIMRYQGTSPESEPIINNGRRTNSPSNPNWKAYKEEEDWYMKTTTSTTPFEPKGVLPSRFRSPSKTSQEIFNVESSPNSPPTTTSTASNSATNHEVVGGGGNGGESTFLQWGHRKRSRRGITMADDTSSSSASGGLLNPPTPVKIQRKLSSPNNGNLMPPPSVPSSSLNGIHQTAGLALKSQGGNLVSSPSPLRRNLEERSQSGGGNRAISGRSRAVKRTSPFIVNKRSSSSSSSLLAKEEIKLNNGGGSLLVHNQGVVNSEVNHQFLSPPQQQQGGGCSSSGAVNDESNSVRGGKVVVGIAAAAAGGGGGGKVNGGGVEVVQWPRIYIPLSRKEKEEDFLAIKGTKLPYRPKKRPKAVDRIIQYCYPGMWLPDVTKGRYEVREKKSSKKQKRRGLKGMESMESDSE